MLGTKIQQCFSIDHGQSVAVCLRGVSLPQDTELIDSIQRVFFVESFVQAAAAAAARTQHRSSPEYVRKKGIGKKEEEEEGEGRWRTLKKMSLPLPFPLPNYEFLAPDSRSQSLVPGF